MHERGIWSIIHVKSFHLCRLEAFKSVVANKMVDPGFVPGLIGAGIAELLHRLILVTETTV